MLKYMIAVPCMDWCPTEFAYSLATLKHVGATRITFISGMAIAEARDKLAREAMDTGADRVLWLDSDMSFADDLLERLDARLNEGWDMCCGIFTKRRLPVTPVIYEHVGMDGRVAQYLDYPRDSLFRVEGCGFGAVLMSTDLLRRVDAAHGALFAPFAGLSEDLSFCARATATGARIACDSAVKVGHVGAFTYGEHIYKHPAGR